MGNCLSLINEIENITMTKRIPIESANILIAGMARNVEPFLEKEIQILLESTKRFNKTYFYVVESDSNDATVTKLAQLRKTLNHFDYLSLGELSQYISSRTDRLAHCRNQVIHAVKSNPDYADIDYVMLADLDGLNTLLTEAKIAQCWQVDEDWDVICANQIELYYDVYALRHPYWGQVDCLSQQQYLEAYLDKEAAHLMAVEAKQYPIKSNAGLIEVDSAFGGLAIYKKEAFILGTYVGQENGHDVCEHVTFHQILKSAGKRIFINSALINCRQPAVLINPELKNRPVIQSLRKLGLWLLGKRRFNKYLDLLRI